MMVASFFTDAKYAKFSKALQVSLDRLGIRHHIERLKDRGGWQKNTHAKPGFILGVMKKYPKEDAVVWVDADAQVLSPLDLFVDAPFEVATYRFRPAQLFHSEEWHNLGMLMNGTAYFKNSVFSKGLLKEWAATNKVYPDRLDQKNLATVLAQADPTRLRCLPPEYCWIERLMRPLKRTAAPVVEHQAISMNGGKNLPDVVDRPVLVKTYSGMGDTFYVRPILRRLAEREGTIYVSSPWPQLISDIPGVKVVRPTAESLRTQKANIKKIPAKLWSAMPPGNPVVYDLHYGPEDFKAGRHIFDSFSFRSNAATDFRPCDFAFKVPESWVPGWARQLSEKGPIAVVHPPTIRNEWKNSSRSPKPEYISAIVERSPQFKWISMAWVNGKEEWFDGRPPKVYRAFHRGQLSTQEMIGITSIAAVVVAGPCFMLPMAAAVETPTFTVFGGSVPPKLLIDERMGWKIGWIEPRPFCDCLQMDHACNKDIPMDDLLAEWREFLNANVGTV